MPKKEGEPAAPAKAAENKASTAKAPAQPAAKPRIDPKVEEIRQKEIQDLLAKSEISLILDSYDDIFSDFDPRPYSERALSDDFLNESRKAARDKQRTVELKFLIPASLRNLSVEAKIRRRLKEHFKKHHSELQKEASSVVRRGIGLSATGFVFMIIATYLYDFDNTYFLITFVRTLFEPAGWFMMWYGLDQIFYTKNEHRQELEFYAKMSSADITFTSS